MIRRNVYEAGELAIVTYLQAKCYNKPFVLLPAPVSGRFQHHCAGFNKRTRPHRTKGHRGQASRCSNLCADHGACGYEEFCSTNMAWISAKLPG